MPMRSLSAAKWQGEGGPPLQDVQAAADPFCSLPGAVPGEQLKQRRMTMTAARAWSMFTASTNIDELLDEIALASRKSDHAKAAYAILREASRDTIPTLAARLFTIDARNARG